MRLIDADKVNETIDRFIGYLDEDMILRIKMKISKIPTVDRPHGEWIEQSDNYGDPYYECSVCEDAFITLEGTPKENHYNFCPNCGADMRKEGEAE